jgi:TolB-like protein
MGPDLKAIYRFDGFTLDLKRGTLLAADGSQLALRPKAFAMLRYLVERTGNLVERDELMQAVWPGVFVTDDSIGQCVKDIRRVLRDETQSLLRTVPRRGYVLTVSVSRTIAGESDALVGDPVSADAAGPMPTPAANRPMIVVLPLENVGGDPEQGYLADGMTMDLVADLTRFQELYVVSPPRQVAGLLALGASSPSGWAVPDAADYVFSGSVRRASGRLRVTVRLDDARTGISLWGERIDRPLEELLTLQEELAERLPAYLVSQIEREATRRAWQRPTNSLDAYHLCLQGREHHLRATEPDTLRARELFARAIELDATYAMAYAWQAWTVQRGFTHLWGEPRGLEAAVRALAFARRAVELQPDSWFCLSRLAFILLLNAGWEEALETARAAVRANPSAADARQTHADVLTHAGDAVEAESEIRLALTLNPFHPPSWRALLGRALIAAGRPEEALAELRFCATRMPSYAPGLHALAAAAAETGRIEEARAAVALLLRNNPRLTVRSACGCLFFRDPAMLERFRTGFCTGGMPEG